MVQDFGFGFRVRDLGFLKQGYLEGALGIYGGSEGTTRAPV